MPKHDAEFLSVPGLAELLDVPVQTVYVMNCEGTGPPRYKIGRLVRYRRGDVEDWLASRRAESGQPTPVTK